MKVNSINNISFAGKIIDAHAHIGQWQGANYSVKAVDKFIHSNLSNGDTVEKIIVSNLSCIDNGGILDEINGNKEILEKISTNSQYAPLAVCQPHKGSVENIKQLFKETKDKFVGLKFHPDCHQLIASNEAYLPYLKFAEENDLPCVFHSGITYKPNSSEFVDIARRYSSPEEIYSIAKKAPKVPVVLAHMGAGGEKVHKIALRTLLDSIENGDANLYADISWVDCNDINKPNIIQAIKDLKNTSKGDMTSRLLFGSDAPIGEFSTGIIDNVTGETLTGKQFYEKSITDIKTAIKKHFPDEAEEITEKIFYKNADELFFKEKNMIKENTENIINNTKNNIKNNKKIMAFAGLIIGTIALISIAFKNKTEKAPQKTTNILSNTPKNNVADVFSVFKK